jgi:type VI protein secretion system component Hcp
MNPLVNNSNNAGAISNFPRSQSRVNNIQQSAYNDQVQQNNN